MTWRLMFGLFIVGGFVSVLGLVGEREPAAIVGGAVTAVILLAAGFLGLRRHPVALYLSLLVLVGSAAQIDIPLLLQKDYVAVQVQRAYTELDVLPGTALGPDDEIVSQIEHLYWITAIGITVLHGWMSLYLWRRRHWFVSPPPR